MTLSSPPGRLPIVARITRRVLWHLKVNDIVKVLEPVSMAQIAQKFERFLETYRRPDGSRWGPRPPQGHRWRRNPLLHHRASQGQGLQTLTSSSSER